MLKQEELMTTPLNKLLVEIRLTNQFEDGVELLLRDEQNEDNIKRLIDELDKAERYYKTLENEIIRRGWLEKPIQRVR